MEYFLLVNDFSEDEDFLEFLMYVSKLLVDPNYFRIKTSDYNYLGIYLSVFILVLFLIFFVISNVKDSLEKGVTFSVLD
jgi:hypothetical protein